MFKDKIKSNTHVFELFNKNKSLNIKYFSDVQHTYGFNNNKLDKIVENIELTPTDYVFIGGDILDSTNHIRESRDNQLVLLRFLEKIAKKHKTFIGLGNHDLFKNTNYGWDNDFFQLFWEEINDIENLSVSCFDRFYEDENIIVYYPNLDFYYYENLKKQEDITKLWDILQNDLSLIRNLDDKKVKIFLIHSPMMLDDILVLKSIQEFDLIISGHMHRGLMPPILNEIIKNNKGIVSPYGQFFPEHVRGVDKLKYKDRVIPLIISGGITKISNSVSFGNILNKIYPMEMEDIKILTKKEK